MKISFLKWRRFWNGKYGDPIENQLRLSADLNSADLKLEVCKLSCLWTNLHNLVGQENLCFWVAAILKCQIQRPHWESALAPGRFELSRSKTISVQNVLLVVKCAPFFSNRPEWYTSHYEQTGTVFEKCSEKKTFTIIFVFKSLKGLGRYNVDPASQTVAQQYFTIGPMYVLFG